MSIGVTKESMSAGNKPINALKAKTSSEVFDFDFNVAEFPLAEGTESRVQADRCLISPVIPKETTRGGIILAHQTQEAATFLAQAGQIVAVGPLWYQMSPFDRIPEEDRLKPGDFVTFQPYQSFKMDLDSRFLVTPLTALLWKFDPVALKEKGIDLQIYS